MSGYIAVVAPEDIADRLEELFLREETDVVGLSGERRLFYVSNSAHRGDQTWFQGFATDHEKELMVFASAPDRFVPDPSSPVEGSYFSLHLSDEKVRFGADLYGFVPMLWFSEKGVSAVSDSYLSLIAIREQLGMSNTVDEESVRGRMWLNSMSYQQIGRETYCREIRYATPGTELSLDLKTGVFEEKALNLQNFYAGRITDHGSAISEAAARMVRMFKTYPLTGAKMTLALSGGQDSRVCLAAALVAGTSESINIICSNPGSPDYLIAQRLGEQFNFGLNRHTSDEGAPERVDTTAAWAATSLGIYDALYMPGAFPVIEHPSFTIGGHGAGSSKGAYGWRGLSDIEMPPSALRQARRALCSIGVDPNDQWGSEWHYLAFRNAIHGGRATLSSDYVARPTAQIPLIGLSRSSKNQLVAPKPGRPSVILDTLIALRPDMAKIPFDTPVKSPRPRFVDQRREALSERLIDFADLPPYRVVGSLYPSKGFLTTQINFAKSRGLSGGISFANLSPMALESLTRFSDLVSPDVKTTVDTLNFNDTRRIAASSREAASVGKLLSLGTVH
ncbi:hypothetical protein FYJ24_09325 [Actinomycetaceae bacterium WB03_NA08]|uniref:Asparagine synthetase domain-containing protein n=1 Tax=Scrofimicrobium canadense TaxID=2652290 RepID=A0A6N7VT53_9ACTO|nr:hypothetical protein [Scrofimicrobium canadense]MSS84959.1 hypothetical protein [Scrofimicrobium canadense]